MKKIAVIMGSDSDLKVVRKAFDTLEEFERCVDHRSRSLSKDCLSNLLLMISAFMLASEIFFIVSI